MKRLAWISLALWAIACDPMGPLPGGALEGTLAEAPADWSTVADEETVQLETRPEDPYSVNLWGLPLADGYYLAAGRGPDATWVKHIQADPNVRLRIRDTVYELRAERIEDEKALELFSHALKDKYDFEASPEQRDRAWIFRLDSR